MNRKVPFFDYSRLWTDDRENLIKIIDETSTSGGFILQKALRSFEHKLAQYCQVNFSVGVGNATDGMEIFLQAIGLSQGDEVIISSHTMLATASAIKIAGGIPVPVDIGSDNLIDPIAIENAINSRTVGIMPTQLNGRVCDMDSITALAKKYQLFVVEDAAQALGAKFNGKYAGSFGLAADISFFPAKVLGSFGDAGAVLVNDRSLYEIIYELHDHGRNVDDGEVKRWGRNSRLDNVQAAILSYKLENYDHVIARRRKIAQIYHDRLSVLDELRLPPPPDTSSPNFDVFQNYELAAQNRNELKEFLQKSEIGTLIQWGGTAVHQFKNLGFTQKCPKADKFFKECVMIPMNMFISDEDVHYVADKIIDFYRS